MPFLVRKIEISKWRQNDIVHDADVSADAITNSLRTTNNTLSTWRIEDSTAVEEAILAIAAQAEHLETIDVVKIDIEKIEKERLEIVSTPGITPYKMFTNNHHDIVNLTYNSLGTVARLVIDCFKARQEMRFTRGKLKLLLISGIRDGRVRLEDLKSSILEKLDLED